MIPFVDLKTQYEALRPQIQERINRVLDHGHYIMGPEVAELEERLAAYTGAEHCITVASGTEALLISLMALGIGPGDEVITTPFTFVATAEVLVLLGAKPVFVDIEPDTCNINVGLIEAAITPRTKAIMPVSLYGQPADMDEINAVAATRHGIAVIEDAAQSFGAIYKGRKSSNLSTIGCTSFFPSKPLGCYGDGGAMFTDCDELARTMRAVRVHGQEQRYVHAYIGVGGRMDTMQCAVVLAKLERFDWELAQRQRVGARYDALFAAMPDFVTPVRVKDDRTSVCAQYTILLESRNEVAAKLKERGVPTAVHYPIPLHLQPAYKVHAPAWKLPVSEHVARHVLSLPMHPYLHERTQDRIVAAVTECYATSAIES